MYIRRRTDKKCEKCKFHNNIVTHTQIYNMFEKITIVYYAKNMG